MYKHRLALLFLNILGALALLALLTQPAAAQLPSPALPPSPLGGGAGGEGHPLAAPTANDDSGPGFITDEDTAFITTDVLANDSDPEGDLLSIESFDTSATLGLVTFVSGSTGALDPTFDGDGKVTTNLYYWQEVRALVQQPDGKLVAAGCATTANSVEFALARYNPDGSLDTTFDGDGKVTTDFFGRNDEAYALVIQPDGKLVAAGITWENGFNDDFALARYNPDGSLDTTFGGDGRVTTDFFGGDDAVHALSLQPDGKIVATGGVGDDFALARYNPDGSLDVTFNGDGKLTTDFFGDYDAVYALLVQPDGKFVAAGSARNGSNADFALARYNPDGSLDLSFDDDGKVTTDFFSELDGAYALILQPDGKLVAAGHAHYRNDFGLARYNPDGSLDPTFGDAGRVTTYLHGGAYALVLQPDGKLVAAGYAFYSLYDYYDFALVRYNPNGSLDTRFDDDGILTTDFFGGDDYAYAVVVQPDGKLIAAGGAGYNYGYDFPDFALARYAGEGFFYNPNGQFEWLAQGQVATDTFTYIVSDGALTDTATVSITVTGVDDAPAAVDDAYSMGEDTVLAVPAPGLLANDSDPENDPLSAALGSPPAQGALALAADGGFVFTPTLDFTGLVTFTYVVSDGILTDTAAVSITVFPNTAPVVQAGPDQAVAEGQVVAFTGSYTDTGQLSVISNPGRSSSALPVTSRQEIIVVTALVVAWDFGDGTGVTGTLTPTHAYGDDGVYTVTLVVTDAWGAAGMDTLVVTASNAAPALAPLADQNAILGQALTVTVAYSDPGWLDTHTAALTWGDGLTATLALSAGLGSFETTHIYALTGSYTATITLADDDGGQDTQAFTVTVDPYTIYLPLILHLLAPVAVDDFGPGFITDEDTPFTLADVLANDYDPNGDLLSIEGFDASAATGLVSFVPGGPPGALDPTFDGDGKVTTDFFDSYDEARALVIQPDGKLVVAGYALVYSSGNDFALARYNPDGSLDPTFDGDGRVTTDFGGSSEEAYALAVQPDGKLVAAGFIGYPNYDFALARYNPDGSLDTTFDGDGKVTTDFFGEQDEAYALVVQPDGKLVVAGVSYTQQYVDGDFTLARYNPDGSLDTTFDGDGKLTTDFFGNRDEAYALLLQPDGKLVAAGNTDTGNYYDLSDFALVRYNPDGSLDASFGGGGKVITDFPYDGGGYSDNPDRVYALALQPDGKLVAAGDTYHGCCAYSNFALARYNPDGSLDLTFGDDGLVTTAFFDNSSDSAYAVVLQPDGSGGIAAIVAAGFSEYTLSDYNTRDFALARYHPDGSLDANFGSGGMLTTDFFGLQDRIHALALQPDGSSGTAAIVAAGYSNTGNGNFALARYESGDHFFYDPNGQFESLAAGEVATDTFTYVVSDGLYTDTATVSITILGVDDPKTLKVLENLAARFAPNRPDIGIKARGDSAAGDGGWSRGRGAPAGSMTAPATALIAVVGAGGEALWQARGLRERRRRGRRLEQRARRSGRLNDCASDSADSGGWSRG